jgi:hypothetical protein
MYRTRVIDREIENWEGFVSKLRDTTRDKDLFIQMLKSSANKYSGAIIEEKGENYYTQSLLMSLMLDQHKKLNKY